jgi:hypothetical protein
MKLKDLFDKPTVKEKDLTKHSENDLISSIKKVIEGAHFNTLDFELKSSDDDLSKGVLKFKHKNKHYKITHCGKIYNGQKFVNEFEPSADIDHHYSSALHKVMKNQYE